MTSKTPWKLAALTLLLVTTGIPGTAAADTVKPPAGTEAEYRLGPEDVMEVFVWKEPERSTTVTVRPDGRISLPLVADLDASGKTGTELGQEITARLSKYIQ